MDGDSSTSTGGFRSVAVNLLLLGFALLATFAVLEIGVRLFVDVAEFAPIGVHDVDPEKRIRFLPNHERTYDTSEFHYTVRFNRFGRRDDEWSDATVADPDGVIFVGDSFVLGNGVEHEATLGSLIEERFAAAGEPREVFNFGMPAGHPPTYLKLLEDALASGFAARTVVVGIFVGNDFYPTVLKSEDLDVRQPPSPGRPPSAGPRSQLVRILQLRVGSSPRMVGWALTVGRWFGISVYDTAGSYIFAREPTREQAQLFQRILDYVGRMRDVSVEHGRDLRVVVFPNRIQVENRDDLTTGALDAARPNRQIMEYCEREGIKCLDLMPILHREYERTGEALYFPIDRHMNERGVALSALAIGEFLEENAGKP